MSILRLFVFAALVSLASGCGGASSPETPTEAAPVSASEPVPVSQPVTVEAILPLTGDLAFLGEPGKAALEIAMEELAGSKVETRFVPADSKATPTEAVSLARKAIDVDGTGLLLVTLSGPSLAVREATKADDVAILSVSIHPDLVQKDGKVVRFCVSAQQEGAMLAEEVAKEEGVVAMVVSRDAATTAEVEGTILPVLDQAGKKPAFVEWFDVGTKDFSNVTNLVKKHSPDAVVLLGYGSDFPAALEAMQIGGASESGTTILGGIGFVEMTSPPKGFEASQFRFVVPAFSVGATGEAGQKFREAYQGKTGKTAPYDAAFTYAAAMAVARLVEQGHSSPADILNGLRGSAHQSVAGEILFDEEGEATTDLRWATFGEAGPVEIPNDAP